MEVQRRLNDRHISILFHGMMKMTRQLAQLESVRLTKDQASSLTNVLRPMEVIRRFLKAKFVPQNLENFCLECDRSV